jgi:hypothetical protein
LCLTGMFVIQIFVAYTCVNGECLSYNTGEYENIRNDG